MDDLTAVIDLALAEDIGPGDWTTLWTVPSGHQVAARIVAKAAGILAGTDPTIATFRRVDPGLEIERRVDDGDAVLPGREVMRIHGAARSILTAERVALNLLQRLSGVATATRAYVDAVAGTAARILDTRKTTPGLRRMEKEAVLAGGGENHRFGLHDMVLIKENHIRAAGGITAAVRAVSAHNRAGLAVEVEATTLDEVREALEAGIDRILLDNMTLVTLAEAVALVRRTSPAARTEASGGVSLATVRQIAETGVDYISVGAVTHSAPALDFSLLVEA
jgi:nicotinate-nucleotide pyrophosphorylase (carboxylating)